MNLKTYGILKIDNFVFAEHLGRLLKVDSKLQSTQIKEGGCLFKQSHLHYVVLSYFEVMLTIRQGLSAVVTQRSTLVCEA